MLEEDSGVLRELAHSCKDYKERERLRALYILSLGSSVKEVSDFFCVNEDTVRSWVFKWEQDKKVKDKPRSGRPESMNEKDRKELKKLVDENNPTKYGVNASLWDCTELRNYFLRKGKNFSIEVLRKNLVKLGGSYVKAVFEYSEADEKERLEFAKKFVKQEKKRIGVVLFEDEMSAGSTRKGYGWTFKKRLVIRVPQKGRKKLNLFGAVSPYTGETIELTSVIAKAPAFIKFLKKVKKKHPRKTVWLYVDRLPVHRSGLVKKFLEKNSNIHLEFFPPYSPDLNPREYWHGFLRKKRLNNLLSKNIPILRNVIHRFTKNTPKQIIKNVCTLKPIYNLVT